MEAKRSAAKPALPARGPGIWLGEHGVGKSSLVVGRWPLVVGLRSSVVDFSSVVGSAIRRC